MNSCRMTDESFFIVNSIGPAPTVYGERLIDILPLFASDSLTVTDGGSFANTIETANPSPRAAKLRSLK